MKIKNRGEKITIFMAILLLCIYVVANFIAGGSEDGDFGGLLLAKPAFAQSTEAGFLEKEAGIAAYTNVSQQLNPARARDAFRTVEVETETYIIGSVALADLAKSYDIHAFVHRDGWIVAYYLKGDSTGKIMAGKYTATGTLANNNLRDGLVKVAGALGVGPANIAYYSFEYPAATKLMLVTGDKFQVKIPSSFQLFETSYAAKSPWSSSRDDVIIDGSNINDARNPTARIDLGKFSPDVFHSAALRSGVTFSLLILYRE